MNRKALIRTLFPKIHLEDVWIALQFIGSVMLGGCVLFGIAFAVTMVLMFTCKGLMYLLGDFAATLIILSPFPAFLLYILIVQPLINRYKRIKMIVELEDDISV